MHALFSVMCVQKCHLFSPSGIIGRNYNRNIMNMECYWRKIFCFEQDFCNKYNFLSHLL